MLPALLWRPTSSIRNICYSSVELMWSCVTRARDIVFKQDRAQCAPLLEVDADGTYDISSSQWIADIVLPPCAQRDIERGEKKKRKEGKKKKKIGLLLRFKIVKLRADEIIVGRMECWASFRGFFDVRHLVSFLIKKTSSLKLRRRIICWHFSIVNWANEMIPFFLNDRIVMIEYSVLENYIYNWNDSSSSFNVKFELLNQEIIAFIKEVIC